MPDLRFAIGALMAVMVLPVSGLGISAALKFVHPETIGPLGPQRTMAFDEGGDWNQFRDPDAARRYAVLARQHAPEDIQPRFTASMSAEAVEREPARNAAALTLPREQAREGSRKVSRHANRFAPLLLASRMNARTEEVSPPPVPLAPSAEEPPAATAPETEESGVVAKAPAGTATPDPPAAEPVAVSRAPVPAAPPAAASAHRRSASTPTAQVAAALAHGRKPPRQPIEHKADSPARARAIVPRPQAASFAAQYLQPQFARHGTIAAQRPAVHQGDPYAQPYWAYQPWNGRNGYGGW